jgi:hypothetical protein
LIRFGGDLLRSNIFQPISFFRHGSNGSSRIGLAETTLTEIALMVANYFKCENATTDYADLHRFMLRLMSYISEIPTICGSKYLRKSATSVVEKG